MSHEARDALPTFDLHAALLKISRQAIIKQEFWILSTLTTLSPPLGQDESSLPLIATASPDDITRAVYTVLGRVGERRSVTERRRQRRHSFPYLVQLTPVEDDGTPVTDRALVVVGRYLSEQGFDFYHQEPLEFRRVIISLDHAPSPPVSLLLDLTWCRFTRQGWYDSGGRFLDVIEPGSLSIS